MCEAKLQYITSIYPEGIVIVDEKGIVCFVNPAAERLLGRSFDNWVGKPFGFNFSEEEIFEVAFSSDGTHRYAQFHKVQIQWEGKRCALFSVKDISEFKAARESLERKRKELDQIFEAAGNGLCVIDKDFNIVRVNETFENLLYLEKESVVGRKCYEAIPGPHCHTGGCPISRIMKGVKHLEYEVNKSRQDGHVMPLVLTVTPFSGPHGSLGGFVQSFNDISRLKKVQERLEKSNIHLQRLLEETVDALSSALEMRDPYTAGHQRRVSELACAIATKMGLETAQVKGIRIAGLIHDIGKIHIPAEILTKPTELTENEFSILKEHPKQGYEIVQKIEFPWPVAEIIVQHHERMDGSGYPRGLSGQDILLEARVVAVADVVDAMGSSRPYRPALGTERALKEIEDNKGRLYDPAVVDACIRVFNGFPHAEQESIFFSRSEV